MQIVIETEVKNAHRRGDSKDLNLSPPLKYLREKIVLAVNVNLTLQHKVHECFLIRLTVHPSENCTL